MNSRVFNYRNFATLGQVAFLLGPAVFPIFVLIEIGKQASSSSFPIGAACVAISACFLFFIVKGLLVAMNEHITLTDTEIIWTDLFGRERVRCALSTIQPGSLTEQLDLAASSGQRTGSRHKWTLKTLAGEIRFRSSITGCGELLRELERRGALAGLGPNAGSQFKLLCNYHTAPMVLGGIVSFILAASFCFATSSMIITPPIDANTHQPEPVWFPLIFGLAALLLIVLFAFCVLAFANERIMIDGDLVVWQDKLGRERVRCTSRDIVPDSFTATERTTSRGASTTIYRVLTKTGPIKFDSNITNSDILAEHFQQMASSSKPAPVDANVSTPKLWPDDPLSGPAPIPPSL